MTDQLKETVRQKIAELKAVFFDFDGVFTDNKVIVMENGQEAVFCSRADGIGLRKLDSLGIVTAIVSSEPNNVVKRRAEKLNIQCINNCKDKLTGVTSVLERHSIPLDKAAFLGNDINDIQILSASGLSVCVFDAYPEVKAISDHVLERKGGNGAVREFCELVYQIQEGDRK